MHKIVFINFFLLIASHSFSQSNYTQYVNPFIGTGGHGHTYPGATLPHGMVQLSPDTRLDGWDGCGGYHYSGSFIYGFTHTHLSGTGVSDFGDILIMPGNGMAYPNNKLYGSVFSHQQESASPGYYAVKLLDDNIDVELTATERVGYHHYHFNNQVDKFILLDLKHRDEVIESYFTVEDSVTISGLRRSKAWADNQYVYFVMKLSQPIKNWEYWKDDSQLDISNNRYNNLFQGKNIKAAFKFDNSASADLFIKVAISSVSIEGAKKNILAEAENKSFEQVKLIAENKWNKELSTIDVTTADTNKLTIFYTALYHTAIVPNINMDVEGSYRGRDNQIHQAIGFTYYSVFSLWDTYRAAHPLYTIIDQKRTSDYINTFLAQYQQGGRLPVWELASCETDCMIGYHSVPVIVDAYMKGINTFDTTLALEAMIKSANWNHYGLNGYTNNGVITSDEESESVSKNLEYAYDDYCIAIYAKKMGDVKTYSTYIKRAQYYKNVFDRTIGFMRPLKNGDWLSPFDPKEVNNHFTEANSWQYSFYFPQDINGYISMIGGMDNLEKKLDALFSENTEMTGRDQSDITGLIGQYAHGNEPSHHIAYLYNYTKHPYKTQALANKIMNEMYKNSPDGLIGNEDCGQMSAWYVMSSLGLYPVTPGNNEYMIGSPQFSLSEIHVENGKSFVINAPGASNKNPFIQYATISTAKSLRPIALEYSFLRHEDIAEGGLVSFVMGDKPANCFVKANQDSTLAELDKGAFVSNPIIHGGGISLREKKMVTISSSHKNDKIYYTADGTLPNETTLLYRHPIVVDQSIILKAIAVDHWGNKSFVTTAQYKKMPHDWTVKLNTAFEPEYDGGGFDGLIDGIHGTVNWRSGNWQGYQKENVDVVIDLKKVKDISSVNVGFLQDTRSWIVMPASVIIKISTDGKTFKNVYEGNNFLSIKDLTTQLKSVHAIFLPEAARYINIVATQYGKLPDWHPGAGSDSHIFVDEIEVD